MNFSLATLLDMVNADNCSSNGNNGHTKRDEEGVHVPCPCQTCIDVDNNSSANKADKETFDLLQSSDEKYDDNLSLHQIDNSAVTSTYNHQTSSSSASSTSGKNDFQLLF